MDTTRPLPLLGGLTPEQFMRRHWQKKPLLVRGAVPGFAPLLARAELFGLAARDDVESRLVVQRGDDWRFRRGPFTRRALPALSQPGWTLLVQGVDLWMNLPRVPYEASGTSNMKFMMNGALTVGTRDGAGGGSPHSSARAEVWGVCRAEFSGGVQGAR